MKIKQKREEIVKALESNHFAVETTEDNLSISFSLSTIGLSGVWAVIPEEEIKYQLENE